MHPLLPFRIVAGLLVLSTVIPIVAPLVTGGDLFASSMEGGAILLMVVFVGLAAKLLWQGERWVAWTLLVLQLPTLLLNGAVVVPGLGRVLSFDRTGVAASLALVVLLAVGLWSTRPDVHDDLASFDDAPE